MLNLTPSEGRKAIEGLSNTELTYIKHLADGKTVPEIAKAVHREQTTVASMLTSARRKLNAKTGPQLVAMTYQAGLLS